MINDKLREKHLAFSIYNSAFTLIELLVAISIIGILAGIVLVSFTGAQKQGRDTQRKNDIRQYLSSLENYANRNTSLYPRRNTTVSADNTLCSDLGLTTCPADPRKTQDSSFDYKYQSDGSASDGTANATKYVLWAKLENTADYWLACSNGKLGTKSQSGFAVSGGNCPI